MRNYVKPIAACCWLLLASCGNSPVQRQPIGMTPEQVRSATDLDQLQNLQKSLGERLQDEDSREFPEEFALLKDINRRVAELHVARLEQILDSKRASVIGGRTEGDSRVKGGDGAVVPLPEIEKLKQELNSGTSEPSLLSAMLVPINREEITTRDLIQTLENESTTYNLSAERRATVYHQLYTISRTEKWREGRDKQMDVIIKAIHAALNDNVVGKNLESRVDFVRSIYSEDPQRIIDDMQGVYAEIFTRRYRIAQSKGDINAAFAVLQNLSRKQDYDAIRAKLQSAAPAIAADYADYVAESIDRKWNLAQSYQRYQQESEVRRILGLPPRPHPKTPELIQQLSAKQKALESQSNPFATLGMLYALQRIEPDSDRLEFSLTHQQTLIQQTTIKTVGVTQFHSRYAEHNYGGLIASLIAERLQNSMGHAVRITQQETGSGVSADAWVLGNVLEVKVNTSQTPNKKQMQVDVGENRRPNPAYMAWLELPPKERAKREKPPEIIQEKKQETISITSTLHRKAAFFAASYRLVDAKSSRVIFPDSITLQADYKDESNEGIEVGTLSIPYKVAKLPTDAEITRKLTRDVAEVIAANLAAILQNQEVEYLKMADQYAAQNKCSQEVEGLAKALTLIQTKKRNAEKDQIRDRLIERTLVCF